MQLTGAEIVIECLKEQGVDTVFGYPGGAILNVYDALYKHSDEITHILTSHEQGASHAADGYARATGKVGVCFATSGPGATNLVTGIATAYMDSIPVVAITCNVGVSLLGKDSFQEIDIAGITMPIFGAIALALFSSTAAGGIAGQVLLISAFTCGVNFICGIYPEATNMAMCEMTGTSYPTYLKTMLKTLVPMLVVAAIIISVAPYVGLV